jgi:hypothetical protein
MVFKMALTMRLLKSAFACALVALPLGGLIAFLEVTQPAEHAVAFEMRDAGVMQAASATRDRVRYASTYVRGADVKAVDFTSREWRKRIGSAVAAGPYLAQHKFEIGKSVSVPQPDGTYTTVTIVGRELVADSEVPSNDNGFVVFASSAKHASFYYGSYKYTIEIEENQTADSVSNTL